MEAKSDEIGGHRARATLKVDLEKVDSIMDLCGELVVIKSQLEQFLHKSADSSDAGLSAIMSLFSKTVREVFYSAMAMRMVSIKPTLMKLERALVDVTSRLGKEINFVVEGNDLELDRTIIDQMSDPLMHLCRNAVDHGIETAAQRSASGKPAVGTIVLRAYHEGSSAVIEISDDGRGIDREDVLAKVRARGWLPPNMDLSKITDAEVYRYLFTPGFSTAEVLNDISGRGIGLDIVRQAAKSLKGDVTVTSTPGVGTTFRVSLPLSTALTDGILVNVGSESFIIPLGIISEFVSVRPGVIETIKTGQHVIRIRGEYRPAFRLAAIFGIESSSESEVAVVTTSSQGTMAIIVDAVLGQSQIVMKKVDDSVHNSPFVAGAAVMGDGRVVLVVDTSVIETKELGGLREGA